MSDDKKDRRYEALDRLIDLLSHGSCRITWADRTIVKIEKIETEAEIKK